MLPAADLLQHLFLHRGRSSIIVSSPGEFEKGETTLKIFKNPERLKIMFLHQIGLKMDQLGFKWAQKELKGD